MEIFRLIMLIASFIITIIAIKVYFNRLKEMNKLIDLFNKKSEEHVKQSKLFNKIITQFNDYIDTIKDVDRSRQELIDRHISTLNEDFLLDWFTADKKRHEQFTKKNKKLTSDLDKL